MGVELGAKKFHLQDAVEAEAECAEMDLVKCVFLCVADVGCGSVFFFQGPLDPGLLQPRYLCSLMSDGVETLEEYDELEEYQCKDGSVCKCEGVCKVRDFLTTRKREEERLPLMKRSGSKLVYKQHLDLENMGLDLESTFVL